MAIIDQILADMQYGDAITDNALAIRDVLVELGHVSRIYAVNIHPRLSDSVIPLDDYSGSDCVIHHFAIGSEVNDFVKNLSVKNKILIYHNITPYEFFSGYNLQSESMCIEARRQLRDCADVYSYALAVSEFNRGELTAIGYRNTDVLPILYNYNKAVRYKRESVTKNILFLGRIAPNKCQQDVIKAFYYYKKMYCSEANLYIAGSYSGMEKYLNELIHFSESLGIDGVHFTGRLSYEQMYKLYSNVDLFLSMSEHEGFCVPLIECMHYNIPILAYEAGAVPETLGNSGVTFNKKDYVSVAGMMNALITDEQLRNKVIESQTKRLEHFSHDVVSGKLKHVLKNLKLG